MKSTLSLRRHYYLKTVSIFLIAVILIAGVVSCEGEPGPEYDLTMAVNPAGAGTATDQTGTSPYEEGEIVDIEAVAAECYRFVDWTAPAGTFGDANNVTTAFTMPARDVTVTANFEPTPPDHFKFYAVNEGGPYVGKDVQLVDQFGAFNATVGYAISFGNPVEKEHDGVTPIADLTRHYTLYELDYGEGEPMLDSWRVMVNNQFQDDEWLTVVGPYYLAVPTQKEDHAPPVCLDHLLVYEVTETEFPKVDVNLKDQFVPDGEDVVVWGPVLFANPVQKTVGSEVTEIETDEHYVFYDIEGASIEKTVQIDNQFGPETLELVYPELLGVPSQKIAWEQPLDHFKTYAADWVDEPPMYEVPVQLEDQFITEWLGEPLNALVLGPLFFANPVNKEHGEVVTPVSNWDNHYTFYGIDYEEIPPVWEVVVDNQFGPDQVLYVGDPLFLAVPTQKGTHDPPVDLDHLLVYEVLGDPPVLFEDVWLWDQFTDEPATVGVAGLFANPVQKTHGPSTEPIKHPDDHLLFYYIDTGEFGEGWLPIANQFGPQVLGVWHEFNRLGVPSQKTGFSIAD